MWLEIGRRGDRLQMVVRDDGLGKRTLEEAERNFRILYENAVEGIFRSTPDGRLLMANQALAEALG